MEMISKGAEANLYHIDGRLLKDRIVKSYRARELDTLLRKSRTKREAKLLSLARRAGVPTPFVFDVDTKNAKIEMSFIEGMQVKKFLETISDDERRALCEEIGVLIGRLHTRHIIHGDLTTSNMIVSDDKIYFIDFGLGEINESVEAKGVDLLLFKKALHSTHHRFEKECLEGVLEGYKKAYTGYDDVLQRLRVIERRGRYFAER